jgi:hypothetical protein
MEKLVLKCKFTASRPCPRIISNTHTVLDCAYPARRARDITSKFIQTRMVRLYSNLEHMLIYFTALANTKLLFEIPGNHGSECVHYDLSGRETFVTIY